jgi:hypothetical protein
MIPTLSATLGVKGRRPVVGTWDGKHLPYVFAVVDPTTAAVHANLPDSPKDAETKTGLGKTRRMRAGFAAHLRHVGRMYPAAESERVVVVIDDAPWRAGESVRAAPAENPHPESKRLPSYSPQLDPIERFWRVLRRRATHNRPFDTLADLRKSLRSSRSYFRTVRDRVRSLLSRKQPKPTTSPGS